MHRVKWCKRRWRLLMAFILLNPAFCAVVVRKHLPPPSARKLITSNEEKRNMHRLRGQIAAREGELRFEVRSEFWAYRFGRRLNRLEWLGRTRGAHTYQLAVASIKSEVLRFSSAIGKMGASN